MSHEGDCRIDQWLWAVRIYKTRTMATEACRKGKVSIGQQVVKPSRQVKTGDVVVVRKPPVNYHFRVLGLLCKRVSAQVAADFVEDITPQEELVKKEFKDTFFVRRPKGTGRPTKKDRRNLDKMTGDQ